MTRLPPISLDAHRLPKSLLRDGWWLVEKREALVIPFPGRNLRPPPDARPQTNKESKS